MLTNLLATILLYSPQAHAPTNDFIYAPPNGSVAISYEITQASKKYNVPRSLLSCILKKESEYKVNVVSKTKDYGIGQINVRTLKKYNLDVYELLNSASYAIDKAAMILSDYDNLNRSDETRTWFCRYNIGYQSLTKPGVGAACERYLHKVNGCLKSEVYL